MMETVARAFCFGDNVNTDYIISSRRKRDTLDTKVLRQYLMEDIRPGFYSELKGEEAVLVGGENFGCGSAMEVAAQVVRDSGIPVVLAKSFARSYYRNALNNGILPVEMDTGDISEGDFIRVAADRDKICVENKTTGDSWTLTGLAQEVMEILECGGIVEYVRRQNNNCVGGNEK